MTISRLLNEVERVQTELDALDCEKRTHEDITHIPADQIVSVYFRQMASQPLLTPEQESLLAQQIHHGHQAEAMLEESDWTTAERGELGRVVHIGEDARRHFARANTRLVISIAKRYRNQGLPLTDLIQEGNVGLMIAIDKFDHERGTRFSTYASWWIRQSITRAVSQKSRTIRLPLHLSGKLRRVLFTMRVLTQELGHKPSPKEIAQEVNLTEDEVEDLLSIEPQMIAIEAQIGDDEDEWGIFLEDETAPDLQALAEDAFLQDHLDELLEQELQPREAEVLRLRFGLNGAVPQTLEQVGKILNLSRESIRQIERRALRRLRHPSVSAALREYA
jgi:RNA polymerase primary sigma factor